MKVDGIVYHNEQDMAEVMNKRFQTVFTEGNSDLTDGEFAENELTEVEVHQERVMKLMKNLEVNKAPGPDGVSNWILRECRNHLVDKIYDLVSLSLSQGRVPKDWKRANMSIVLVFKGGSRENPLNYRPVPLMSAAGKMCERIVKEAWMNYLEDSNVLMSCQFGFRRGREFMLCKFVFFLLKSY